MWFVQYNRMDAHKQGIHEALFEAVVFCRSSVTKKIAHNWVAWVACLKQDAL